MLKSKRSTFALVITGAVTCGKTTLTKKISSKTKLEIINEDTAGNFYKIIREIDSLKHPRAIFEHCYLYNQAMEFAAKYDKTLIIFLNVTKDIFLANYQKRLSRSNAGDFTKIDPIKHQLRIQEEFGQFRSDFQKSNIDWEEIYIDKMDDYNEAKKILLNKIPEL